MKAKWMIPVAGLALAGTLMFAQADTAKPESKSAQIGQLAPDFTLKDTFGKEFKLTDFKDKIVVLEWLNQGCPVSKGLHKKQVMQDVYKKYAAKDVVWIGIDSTAGAQGDKNRVYAAEMGLAYPILTDADGKVGHTYGASNTPHMFVIDKAGKLAYTGAIDDQDNPKTNYVAAAIDDLLANRTVATSKTAPYGCAVHYARGK